MALGSVSTAAFTRAEIDTMLKRAVYSDGQVVWTGTATLGYNSRCNLVVPDEVDYIEVTFPSKKPDATENGVSYSSGAKQHLARGSSIDIGIGYIGNASKPMTAYISLSFKSDGSLTSTYAESNRVPDVPIHLTGRHYY